MAALPALARRLERRERGELFRRGGNSNASRDDDAWALATKRDAPVRLGLLNHRGDWGARVRSAAECGAPEEGFRGGTGGFFRCSRCDARGPSGATLVTFPCGHTFHDACAPEEACVACLVERGDGSGGEGESSSAWGEKARVRAAVDAELAAVTRAET